MTLTELAEAVNVAEDDLRVVLSWMADDVPDGDIPTDVATDVHRILNPNSERTVPQLYYRGLDPDAGTGATKMR